jgi:hypothetical protein
MISVTALAVPSSAKTFLIGVKKIAYIYICVCVCVYVCGFGAVG